jgi:hypothetical protein
MKIKMEKNVVEFHPESEQETTDLERLWRRLIDCMGDSKKITPIGEYIPSKKNTASFYIEGVPGGATKSSDKVAPADGTYYCATCNKYINLKKGDTIPLCCGKPMEPMD